jgi:hypothetical protein
VQARIVVDLPSAETDRRRSPLEWLRSLFGAQLDLRSGREELTMGTVWLIEGLVEAFAAAGVRDVKSFLVDDETIYLDAAGVPDDLPLIVHAAETAGLLDRKFREMHLVLAHRTAALEAAIDCRVRDGVLLGEAELTIDLTGHPCVSGDGGFEPAYRELDALAERVAIELNSVLDGARVTRADTDR